MALLTGKKCKAERIIEITRKVRITAVDCLAQKQAWNMIFKLAVPLSSQIRNYYFYFTQL